MPSPHATCEYSWIRPPSRSRRRTRMLSSAGAAGVLASCGAGTAGSNAVCEGRSGTAPADRILIAGRRHLHHTLSEYVDHYNTHRPHRTLSQQPRRGLRRGASWAAWPVLEVTDAVLALRRHAQQRHTRCLKLSEKPEPVPQLD